MTGDRQTDNHTPWPRVLVKLTDTSSIHNYSIHITPSVLKYLCARLFNNVFVCLCIQQHVLGLFVAMSDDVVQTRNTLPISVLLQCYSVNLHAAVSPLSRLCIGLRFKKALSDRRYQTYERS